MKLMLEPPLYYTNGINPENIIGKNIDLFLRHFQAWMKNESEPGKIEKMFTDMELETIGGINKRLLAHGFRARYMREGRIVYGIICSGDKRQILPDNGADIRPSSSQHARMMIQEIRGKLDKFYVPF